MTARNFSPWRWFLAELADTTVEDPCPTDGDRSAVTAWQRRGRRRLRGLMGRLPERVPLNVDVVESVDCGSYRRDKVVYDTERHMSVPAWLLVPHDRSKPGPAVLAQHGHGPGKDEVVGLAEVGDEGSPPNEYGHLLAEQGYVVLAPDLRTFGERVDWNPPNLYDCDLENMHASMLGRSLLAADLWDLARGLDLLADHPLVDPLRLGMVGLSQGGTCTLFLAAWDRRVRASVVSGYFNQWSVCAAIPWNMCGSQVLPGVAGAMDHVELGALIAPRALLIESGTKDNIFPAPATREQYARLAGVYTTLGQPDRVQLDQFEGGHRWHGELAYPFLRRWL